VGGAANPARMLARVRAALGFQARTGWAALVALAGTADAPVLALRRRIELVDGSVPAHVFHAAKESDDPRLLVQSARRVTRTVARRAVREAVRELEHEGHRVVGMGLGVGTGTVPDRLEAILASHALLHAAEGELYRQALIDAGDHYELPVVQLPRRTIADDAATALGVRPSVLRDRVAAMGRAAGPPWRQEQKEAVLAACVALAPRRRASAR
jgi:hypothetical protein